VVHLLPLPFSGCFLPSSQRAFSVFPVHLFSPSFLDRKEWFLKGVRLFAPPKGRLSKITTGAGRVLRYQGSTQVGHQAPRFPLSTRAGLYCPPPSTNLYCIPCSILKDTHLGGFGGLSHERVHDGRTWGINGSVGPITLVQPSRSLITSSGVPFVDLWRRSV